MRRNVVFDMGQDRMRADDEGYRELHLDPLRGAEIGDYGPRETAEYSDAYYGPGDRYPRRQFASGGYSREQEPYLRDYVEADTAGHIPRTGWRDDRLYGTVRSYGELDEDDRSWADLGVQTVQPGAGGTAERSRPSYRGRGPKGYRRSDARTRELICEHLTDEPHIDASDVNVEVEQGEVTLTGTVPDLRTKWLVEEVAAQYAPAGDASSQVQGSEEPTIHNRLTTRRAVR